MTALFDNIGKTYASVRQPDPRIAAQIRRPLAGAESILNIGAGTGAYEPDHPKLIALEPSQTMIDQRRQSAWRLIRGFAEAIPLDDDAVSHVMTVLSMHHWSNRAQAFAEIRRVCRERLVIVSWDPAAEPFWLTRDYFPEIHARDLEIFPTMEELETAFGPLNVSPLMIPADCRDGFLGAYWQRPEAYLNDDIRNNMSTFLTISNLADGIESLRADLDSGRWRQRNAGLLDRETFDIGYRLIVVDLGS